MDSFKLVKAACFISIQFGPVCGYMFKIYHGKRALANSTDTQLSFNIDDCILFCLNKVGCRRANYQNGICELLEGNIQIVENDEATSFICKFPVVQKSNKF